MADPKLVAPYIFIHSAHGSNFTYDCANNVMVREIGDLVISIGPPQEGLKPGEKTHVLLTAPLLYPGKDLGDYYESEKKPEELRNVLDQLISKRDALARKTYQGQLRVYDDGIEYVYDIPTADESKLAKIVRDFNDI